MSTEHTARNPRFFPRTLPNLAAGIVAITASTFLATAQGLEPAKTRAIMHRLSFDDMSGRIGDHYPGVIFSPGWSTWEPKSRPDYIPTSGAQVAFSQEEDNWIEFSAPAHRVRMTSSYYDRDDEPLDYIAADREGRELERIQVTPGNRIPVVFESSGIHRIVIIGVGNWRTHHVIDDLSFVTLPAAAGN